MKQPLRTCSVPCTRGPRQILLKACKDTHSMHKPLVELHNVPELLAASTQIKMKNSRLVDIKVRESDFKLQKESLLRQPLQPAVSLQRPLPKPMDYFNAYTRPIVSTPPNAELAMPVPEAASKYYSPLFETSFNTRRHPINRPCTTL